MKIALPEVSHLGEDAELLPRGTRDLINDNEAYVVGVRAIDLHRIISPFMPRFLALMENDKLYDYNLPQSIDAAYMIASDMYSSGQCYQSVLLVFIAAILSEFGVNFDNIKKLSTATAHSPYSVINSLAHIHSASVNTQTTNLLRDFLSEKVKTHNLKKDTQSMLTNTDYVLFKIGRNIPKHPKNKLITVFHELGPDYYRELGLYENSSVAQAVKACILEMFDDFNANRKFFLNMQPKLTMKVFGNAVISVNGEAEYRVSIYAKNSIREIGVKEGDVIRVVGRERVVKDDEVTTSTSRQVSQKGTKKNSGKMRNGKSKRKAYLVPSPKQLPTEEQLKEAHSMKMESVLNEMRPKFQGIRRKLDSLALKRQVPKQRKDLQEARSADKENTDCNFIDKVSTSGGKAGKVAYPILVGLDTNLYISSKGKNARRSKAKVVSLDLYGLSKRKALDKLKKSLPQWVDVAMKGAHPFVIPVDIICGGGSQELSEVVATWIRSEKQVANRPKGF